MQPSGIDKVVYALRKKFSQYGYNEYKMNKFEEYDLYARNKDFLISGNVITFNDTNGKLLALKPDVTLSIVKNTKIAKGVKKVFYYENVYRVSSKSNGFKEIPQMGLECVGNISLYNVAEVITLAKESLESISSNNVLEISPVGVVFDFVSSLNLKSDVKKELYKLIDGKNVHELKKLLCDNSVSDGEINTLIELITLYGSPKTVIEKLKKLFNGKAQQGLVENFQNLILSFGEENLSGIMIDCSACKNVKYYNDITFRGYVSGLPKAVLSGGRYDDLLKSMGSDNGAIGFAVYLDELDRLFKEEKEYDVDVAIIYDENSNIKEVLEKVKEQIKQGKTVTAINDGLASIVYKEIIKI